MCVHVLNYFHFLNNYCSNDILPMQGSKGYKKVYGKKAPKTFDDGPITSQPGGGNKGTPEGGYITRVTGDEREDEMDQNLRLVL